MQDLTTFIANHLGLTYAFAGALLLLMIIEILRAKRGSISVNTSQAVQLINKQHAVVIDVRSKELYKKSHILDSVCISGQELQENPKKLEKYRAKPLIIVCGAGNESQKVAAQLSKQGYNVYSLSGGIRAWGEAEMPLVRE